MEDKLSNEELMQYIEHSLNTFADQGGEYIHISILDNDKAVVGHNCDRDKFISAIAELMLHYPAESMKALHMAQQFVLDEMPDKLKDLLRRAMNDHKRNDRVGGG